MTRIAPEDVHTLMQRWTLADGMPLVCDLAASHGSWLVDARDGEEYLDLFGFFASRAVAYDHPMLCAPEYKNRLLEASLIKPANCDVYTTHLASFVDNFATKALDGAFPHLFFVEGGSLAVENALKAAIDWKVRCLGVDRGSKIGPWHEALGQRSKIIHFERCFHGRSGYCLSLTDSPDPRKSQIFPKFTWPRLEHPTIHFDAHHADPKAEDVRLKKIEDEILGQIQALCSQKDEPVAAVLIEPIQGEGGDRYCRTEFLQALRTVCDATDTLLIFDEVQTGFCATGHWWDWQNHGVKPDILVFGKKTQVCGIAASDRLDRVDSVFSVPSRISSTFSGGLADMVRCDRLIDIVMAEDLQAHVRRTERLLAAHLQALAQEFSMISNVRGRGLWWAFDLPNSKHRDAFLARAWDERLLILPCGDISIRLRPALDIEQAEVDEAARRLLRIAHGCQAPFLA